MVHSCRLEGLTLQTGDLICTADGGGDDLTGQFWRLIGKLIPGEVDHIVVYVGPGGRCVEAGAQGKVITFEITDDQWDAEKMIPQRGRFIDTLFGAAYPLAGRNLDEAKAAAIREQVAQFCLEQAAWGKPYNMNFFDSGTNDAFYCSQLAYQAYLANGIDLDTGLGIPNLPGTDSIIFPQEIWSGCVHQSAKQIRNGLL